MIDLKAIVDELLNIEKKPETKRTTFFQRVHNFAKRQEIEKALKDEIDFENQNAMRLGKEAEAFLNSKWYAELVEPHIRSTIHGGLQTIIRDGENMTEAQLKSEIAVIKRYLTFFASLKLKMMRSDELREGI